MRRKIPEKSNAVEKLMRQVAGKPNVDKAIDEAVRSAL